MSALPARLQMLWLMSSPPRLFSRLYELPWYREMLEQWAEPLLHPGARVLEVGCATGGFARALAERGMQVCAVDRSPRMLAHARQAPGAVRFTQADAAHLPFSDGHFDVVMAASLINLVVHPGAVLAEMRRVCRVGGVVSVLAPSHAFSGEAARRYMAACGLSGISAAAFWTWHRSARKMDADRLSALFRECGMHPVRVGELLGGMALTVSSGRR